jgi:hypothetical protein
MDGIYTLQLSVTQGNKTSTDSIDITVDTSLPTPAVFSFANDIVPIIGSNADGVFGTQGCDGCHFDFDPVAAGIQGGSSGIPVAWDTSAGTDPYATVLTRVNLTAPHDSLFLRKPLGNHHGGGTVYDLNSAAGLRDYNTVLSWITEGAKP